MQLEPPISPHPSAAARIASEQGDLMLLSSPASASTMKTELIVPSMHCGGCMRKIEKALTGLDGVVSARANLSNKRVAVVWDKSAPPPPLAETLTASGFQARIAEGLDDGQDPQLRELFKALGVAAFASSNIMLLSFGVWSGAEAEARQLFHTLSFVVALPTFLYSGRIFYRSAWNALRHRRTNMDVPISVGVILTFGLSTYETFTSGPHAYFDAAASLLLFLLAGRTLDQMMRTKARVAVAGLARLSPSGATVVGEDGTRTYIDVNRIEPGMTLFLIAGDRVPVDAMVISGNSDIDMSFVTGENVPVATFPGQELKAGTLILTAPVTVLALRRPSHSFLAQVTQLMVQAESGRSRYRRIADRAAALYAPLVHTAALVTFLGWFSATGDTHFAITTAIAVLIVTCPCALGLAVPIVQVVAARRLFEAGILLKDGGALERLSEINTVVFDKTGTLTTGQPKLSTEIPLNRDSLSIAACLAEHSRHPYSQALAAAQTKSATATFNDVVERPGAGIEAMLQGARYRLGQPAWALTNETEAGGAPVVLSRDGMLLQPFHFEEVLRDDAEATIALLKARNIHVEIISGDSEGSVAALARYLDVPYTARTSPAAKVERLKELKSSGRHVLMIGDGINDAAALAAAHVSMAPVEASDLGRAAADMVFMFRSLLAVTKAHTVARTSSSLVKQNFILSIVYNLLAIPVAVSGFLTPLLAAIAMSASSITVVLNALRLPQVERRATGARATDE